MTPFSSPLSLNLAISTVGEFGIGRVARMILPPCPNVSYVVSWQSNDGIPLPSSLQKRNDVKVVRTNSKGVSANRNIALENCEADIVLICDDDMVYNKETFRKILSAFEKNPEIDMAIFKVAFPFPKVYPTVDMKLIFPYPKNFYPASVEIAFRSSKIGNLKFWEGMGLGTEEMTAGEDELFLFSAIKRGLNVWFINQLIGSHAQMPTGFKPTLSFLKSQGFLISLTYPFTALPRLSLKAYRVYKTTGLNFFKALGPLISGSVKAFNYRNLVPKRCRW